MAVGGAAPASAARGPLSAAGSARPMLGSGASAPLAGAAPLAQAAETLPANFQDTVLFSGLNQPTVVRFAPDGRVFVAQKDGEIFVYDSLTGTPKLFYDLSSEVNSYADRGLLGLALDPGFPQRPYVYALFTYDAPIGGTAPVFHDACSDPNGQGCVVSGRLVRLTANGDAGANERTLISDQWCQQFPSHSIGTLEFGPDGELYVSAGEGASYKYADYGQTSNPCGDPPGAAGTNLSPPAAQGGALRAQSARRPSGEPAVLNGAVLRVNPDTGAAAAGNPLSGDADRSRIVAYGLRSPFRFTFRPGTGELWIGDVGWRTWEEIDRAPAPTTNVENFGWPCYEGVGAQGGYQSIGLDSCTQLQGSQVTAPYFSSQHGQPVFDGDSCPTGVGSSIAGLAFYTGGTYPAGYNGGLFFSDYSRECIYFMPRGSNGLPDPSQVRPFITAAVGPVNLQIGPDGDLYYPGYDDGTIRRITYAAPVAAAAAAPTSGPAPLTVRFDSSGSSSVVSYAWDLDGDGQYNDSTSAAPSFTYTTVGVYHPRLQVTDSQGATSVSAPLTITVGAPRAVTIEKPGSPRSSSPLRRLLGTTHVGSHAFFSSAGRAVAFSLSADRGGTLQRMRIYLAARDRARRVLVGLFTSTHGRPERALGHATLQHGLPGAWNELRLRSASLRPRKQYWLVLLAPSATLGVRYATKRCTMLLSRASHLRALPHRWLTGGSRRACEVSASGWG